MHSQQTKQELDSLLSILPVEINSTKTFNNLMLVDFGQFKTYNQLNGQYLRQENQFSSAVKWAIKYGSDDLVIKAKLALFFFYSANRKDELAIEKGTELLKFENSLTEDEMLKLVLRLQGTYKSIEAYNEIVKLLPYLEKYVYNKMDLGLEEPRKSAELGWAYYHTRNYAAAAEQFLAEANYFEKRNLSKVVVASMINNAGLSYAKIGNYRKAKESYTLALIKLDEAEVGEDRLNSKEYISYFKEVVLGSSAEIDFKNGNYESALPVFKRLINLSRSPNIRDKFKEYQSQFFVSEIYSNMNYPSLALKFLDSAAANVDNITDRRIKIEELRGKIYLQLGDTDLSVAVFRNAQRLSDSIQQVQISRDNMVAQAKYLSLERDKELDEIKEEIILKDKLNKYQWYAIFISLFLIAIIGYYYFISLRSNRIINGQKVNLEASVKEKEILLKEIHHRVKNNLQVITGLLQLQSKKTDSPAMLLALQDSQRQVNSMALVHEMLFQQEDQSLVPMSTYLTKLTNQLLYSLSSKNITAKTSIEETIELSINKAIPLGLILSELLSNTYKYAFNENEGLVTVVLIKNAPFMYTFRYSDNGKGLPSNFDIKSQKTLGFRLLHMLAEELGGEIFIDGTSGLKIEVIFKDENSNG